jgi:hypothetical protein
MAAAVSVTVSVAVAVAVAISVSVSIASVAFCFIAAVAGRWSLIECCGGQEGGFSQALKSCFQPTWIKIVALLGGQV